MEWNKEWVMGAVTGWIFGVAFVMLTQLVWWITTGSWEPPGGVIGPALVVGVILNLWASLKWKDDMRKGTVRNRPTR